MNILELNTWDSILYAAAADVARGWNINVRMCVGPHG